MATSQNGAGKKDAHQALTLLEEYSTHLGGDKKALQSAINRLIRVFRTRLFQALLDIQDFYEDTLLSDEKPQQAKISRALEMAARWETNSFIPATNRDPSKSPRVPAFSADQTPPVPKKQSASFASPELPPPPADAVDGAKPSISAKPVPSWQYDEITYTLSKDNPRDSFGFGFVGGVDAPIVPNDPHLYVNIVPHSGRAAAYLKPNDQIASINGFDVGNGVTSHAQAIDLIKDAGLRLVLVIRRGQDRIFSYTEGGPIPADLNRQRSVVSAFSDEKLVTLRKNKATQSLGFSIKGGSDNIYLEGSVGIFVFRLYENGLAALSKGVSIGDQLISVNGVNLENVAHEQAVSTLKNVSDVAVMFLRPSALSGTDTKMPRRREADERKVMLSKPDGVRSLGINIVGGDAGEGIFVSFIMSGGVADQNNELKRGDKILEVDGHDFAPLSHGEAAAILKGSGQRVEMVIAFRPQEYGEFEKKLQHQRTLMAKPNSGTLRTSSKKSMHVRVLFSYDKTRDSGLPSEGLSFRFGDILHVTNAADKEWWQAKHVNLDTNADEGSQGVVPSKERYEKRERARNRRVNFGSTDLTEPAEERRVSLAGKGSVTSSPATAEHTDGAAPRRRRSFTFSKRLPFMKKQERDPAKPKTASTTEKPEEEEKIASYDVVELETISYRRPIVILGPFKDRINDELCSENPDLFGTCVPHTSRQARSDETGGVDYHFVSVEVMQSGIQDHHFVEAGTYNSNLYGTSVEAVQLVATKHQKHCVLDVSGYAIKRLLMAGLHPIAIFIKPTTVDQIRNHNKRVTDEAAHKSLERCQRIEEEFKEYLTAIIEADMTHDEMLRNVMKVISVHGNQRSWLTANPPPPPSQTD
ncbi:disks large homolog 4-like [Sycon ciliatum]|uniref:disks large homolog 4-like n=1 Tax=Sycon ciliatum TaxID=27933 RepID=UPI0020AE4D6C|eukprot:scpid32996/ scgid34110/ Disks large homolog 1; Synapse-associated protein 97